MERHSGKKRVEGFAGAQEVQREVREPWAGEHREHGCRSQQARRTSYTPQARGDAAALFSQGLGKSASSRIRTEAEKIPIYCLQWLFFKCQLDIKGRSSTLRSSFSFDYNSPSLLSKQCFLLNAESHFLSVHSIMKWLLDGIAWLIYYCHWVMGRLPLEGFYNLSSFVGLRKGNYSPGLMWCVNQCKHQGHEQWPTFYSNEIKL